MVFAEPRKGGKIFQTDLFCIMFIYVFCNSVKFSVISLLRGVFWAESEFSI